MWNRRKERRCGSVLDVQYSGSLKGTSVADYNSQTIVKALRNRQDTKAMVFNCGFYSMFVIGKVFVKSTGSSLYSCKVLYKLKLCSDCIVVLFFSDRMFSKCGRNSIYCNHDFHIFPYIFCCFSFDIRLTHNNWKFVFWIRHFIVK